jgi:small-conductance mechanosensitive channel
MCTEILEHAILNCGSIMAAPSPTLAVKSINALYSEYEITFFVSELAIVTQARNELFDWIFRHVAAADIDLAFPQNLPSQAASPSHRRTSSASPQRILDLVTSNYLRHTRTIRAVSHSCEAEPTFTRKRRNTA